MQDLDGGETIHMERYMQTKKSEFLSDYEEYSPIIKQCYDGQYIEPVILVLGKTGTGKSSLCNAMAGLPPDTEDENEGFPRKKYSWVGRKMCTNY